MAAGQPGGVAPRRGLWMSALPGKTGLPPKSDDGRGQRFGQAFRAGGGLGDR